MLTRLTDSVFIYNKACTVCKLGSLPVCLTRAMCLSAKRRLLPVYNNSLSTTRLVLPVCKLGSLPVYLSTTRVIANVFICKKASTSSVFFYNKDGTACVVARLTTSGVFIYNKACTANVLTRLTDSVYIYNKACTASV